MKSHTGTEISGEYYQDVGIDSDTYEPGVQYEDEQKLNSGQDPSTPPHSPLTHSHPQAAVLNSLMDHMTKVETVNLETASSLPRTSSTDTSPLDRRPSYAEKMMTEASKIMSGTSELWFSRRQPTSQAYSPASPRTGHSNIPTTPRRILEDHVAESYSGSETPRTPNSWDQAPLRTRSATLSQSYYDSPYSSSPQSNTLLPVRARTASHTSATTLASVNDDYQTSPTRHHPSSPTNRANVTHVVPFNLSVTNSTSSARSLYRPDVHKASESSSSPRFYLSSPKTGTVAFTSSPRSGKASHTSAAKTDADGSRVYLTSPRKTAVKPFNLSTTNVTSLASRSQQIDCAESLKFDAGAKEVLNRQRQKQRRAAKLDKQPKPTVPAPFPLRSVELHNKKMSQIAEAHAAEERAARQDRIFSARSCPTTVRKPCSALKSHLPVNPQITAFKAFALHSDQRHNYRKQVLEPRKALQERKQQGELAKVAAENRATEKAEIKALRQKMEFKATKSVVVNKPPHALNTKPIPLTKIKSFHLKTDDRMAGRFM